MHLTLALETSNPTSAPGSVALGRVHPPRAEHAPADTAAAIAALLGPIDIELLGAEPLHPVARHEDDLLPAIARLCERCNVKPRDIQQIAVSVGPGGYTALRMTVAAAKMIAEATGAHTISVPTAAAVARATRGDILKSAGPGAAPPPFAVALAGKQDTAHLTVFAHPDLPGFPTAQGRLITAADIAALPGERRLPAGSSSASRKRRLPAGSSGSASRERRLPAGSSGSASRERRLPAGSSGSASGAGPHLLVADRFLPAPIRTAAEAAHIHILPPRFEAEAVLACAALAPPSPPDPAAAAAPLGIRPVDPTALLPLYGRDPEAVRLWQQRSG